MAMTVRPRISRSSAVADRFLGLDVERRGRLVQQQDRRVLQEGAGDRDPLALAAGKLDAALADHCGEALGHGLDEAEAARRACRGDDFLVAGFGPAIADVVHDRAVEERDVLGHDADLLAQALLGHQRDVLAVDQDAAGLEIVEALQQGEDGRFAAARFADQPDALAGLDAQVEVLEDLGAAGIGEADILEDDAALARRRTAGRTGWSRISWGRSRVPIASASRAICWVTSTKA